MKYRNRKKMLKLKANRDERKKSVRVERYFQAEAKENNFNQEERLWT